MYNTKCKYRNVRFVSSATQIIYPTELQPVVCTGLNPTKSSVGNETECVQTTKCQYLDI